MKPVFPAYLIARLLLILMLLAGMYFLRGFIVPALASLIIGLASWPLYQRLVRACKGSTILASSLALVIILIVLVVPLLLILSFAINEAGNLIAWLLAANRNGVDVPVWIYSLPRIGERLASYWNFYFGEPHALGALVEMTSGQNLGNIYRLALSTTGNVFHLVLAVLFMLITLFFVYKDGDRMLAQIDLLGERVFPARWHQFSRVVPATISSTVTGMGLIAIGEGVLLGTAYWIAEVPSPVLFGTITGFMALIPGGAPLSFTLVSLYLIGSGKFIEGFVLLTYGSIELFVVDKTIRPRLVGGPVKLPFLPTFFGLVGGVSTLGIVGLFLGPVLMALLVSVWREWLRDVKNEHAALSDRVMQQYPAPSHNCATDVL